jgi:hypothetical protein
MNYAENTSVPVGRTREEIERMLTNAGADRFGAMSGGNEAVIAFQLHGKMVRIHLPLPGAKHYEFTPKKLRRSPAQIVAAREQDHKARWRALALGIKAKLIFIESGIRTFEQEFLSDIVAPSGKTIGETLIPQLEEARQSGKLPQLTLN